MSELSGNDKLINFINDFTDLLERELATVRDLMENTLGEVMKGVTDISAATEGKKRDAEKALEETYLNPDAETQVLVESIQDSVDQLVSKVEARVAAGDTGDLSDVTSGEPEAVLRNRMKRFQGKFLKHFGEIDNLDNDLRNLLFGIMGALSSDDVIAQRLTHVSHSMHALHTSLGHMLLDFTNRCHPDEIDKMKGDVLRYVYSQFTMEDEKRVFKDIFGDVQTKKAS